MGGHCATSKLEHSAPGDVAHSLERFEAVLAYADDDSQIDPMGPDSHLLELPPGERLTVMMFGKTGSGKSSLGNLIAGSNVFASGDDTASITNLESIMKYTAEDESLIVLDTIGLGDTEIDQEKVIASIRDTALSAINGVDILLLVMRNERITDDTIMRLVYLVECLWGCECLPNLYVVISCAGRYLRSPAEGVEWINKQVEINWRFQFIYSLVDNNPNRFIFLDNPDLTSEEPGLEERRKMSLDAVMKLLVMHPREIIPPFTHGMMKKAQEMVKDEKNDLEAKETEFRRILRALGKDPKTKATGNVKRRWKGKEGPEHKGIAKVKRPETSKQVAPSETDKRGLTVSREGLPAKQPETSKLPPPSEAEKRALTASRQGLPSKQSKNDKSSPNERPPASEPISPTSRQSDASQQSMTSEIKKKASQESTNSKQSGVSQQSDTSEIKNKASKESPTSKQSEVSQQSAKSQIKKNASKERRSSKDSAPMLPIVEIERKASQDARKLSKASIASEMSIGSEVSAETSPSVVESTVEELSEADLLRAQTNMEASRKVLEAKLEQLKRDNIFKEEAARQVALSVTRFKDKMGNASSALNSNQEAAMEAKAGAGRRWMTMLKSDTKKPVEIQKVTMIETSIPMLSKEDVEHILDAVVDQLRQAFGGRSAFEVYLHRWGEVDGLNPTMFNHYVTLDAAETMSKHFQKPENKPKFIAALWRRADKNCDGKVDIKEFRALFGEK